MYGRNFKRICTCGLKALVLSVLFVHVAASAAVCSLSLRPKTGELAFAPVGRALTFADEVCINDSIVIPYEQTINAVTLMPGQYARTNQGEGFMRFALKSLDGRGTISSCKVCDGLKYLMVSHEGSLCVLSSLNVLTCAPQNRADFLLQRYRDVKENVCTTSLIYAGRDKDNIRFNIKTCKNEEQPSGSLSYDLSLGTTIRFLDERFRVVEATNQGLYYQRL